MPGQTPEKSACVFVKNERCRQTAASATVLTREGTRLDASKFQAACELGEIGQFSPLLQQR
jgi:hypothetical protein